MFNKNLGLKAVIEKAQWQLLVNLCLHYRFREALLSQEQFDALKRDLIIYQDQFPKVYKDTKFGGILDPKQHYVEMPHNHPDVIEKAIGIFNSLA